MCPSTRLLVLLLLGLARTATAAQLWAAWELDLGDHAPPQHFVLTVTSPPGTPVPPPLTVPWATCPNVPGAQHCAPVGCPPSGIYDFIVQAQYEEGLSGPSNMFRCSIVNNQCTCSPVGILPPVSHPPPTGGFPATVGGGAGTIGGGTTTVTVSIPPIPPGRLVPGPQLPPGLTLVPVGPLPELPPIPPIPTSAGA